MRFTDGFAYALCVRDGVGVCLGLSLHLRVRVSSDVREHAHDKAEPERLEVAEPQHERDWPYSCAPALRTLSACATPSPSRTPSNKSPARSFDFTGTRHTTRRCSIRAFGGRSLHHWGAHGQFLQARGRVPTTGVDLCGRELLAADLLRPACAVLGDRAWRGARRGQLASPPRSSCEGLSLSHSLPAHSWLVVLVPLRAPH